MAFTSGHGNVSAYWKGNLLIVEPESTFNVEGIIEAGETIKAVIDQVRPKEWIRVIHFRHENIVGPVEGAKYIVESLQYSQQKGCSLVCVAGGNAMNKEGYKRVCEVVGLPVHCFDSLVEAEAFISRMDYCLP